MVVPAMVSANIQIDGDPSDWSSVDYLEVDDPNEPAGDPAQPDYWDIDTVKFHWDGGNEEMNWVMQAYDSVKNSGGGNWSSEIMYLVLDTDRKDSTGTTRFGADGIDYQFEWYMSPDQAVFRQYTGSGWQNVTGYTYDYARDNRDPDNDSTYDYDCYEIRIPYGAITDGGTKQPNVIEWGWAYDNSDEPWDDKAPDTMDEPGDVPEPATTALLIIGLAGLAYKKRQQSLQE